MRSSKIFALVALFLFASYSQAQWRVAQPTTPCPGGKCLNTGVQQGPFADFARPGLAIPYGSPLPAVAPAVLNRVAAPAQPATDLSSYLKPTDPPGTIVTSIVINGVTTLAGQSTQVPQCCGQARPQASGEAMAGTDAALFAGINAKRTSRGCAPLSIDPSLQAFANGHAQTMANERRMRHSMAAVAENVAAGSRGMPLDHAIEGWDRSPGHHANLMNPRFTRTGVATAVAADGSHYSVQVFR